MDKYVVQIDKFPICVLDFADLQKGTSEVPLDQFSD